MSQQRQRMYLGVMVLGAVALFVDRFVLRASVSGPDAALATGSRIAPETGSPQPVAIPELPFPTGVRDFKLDGPIRDLFLPPMFRYGGDGTLAADNRSHNRGTREDGRASREAFLGRNRLDALLTDDRMKIAIVNGRWVRIGQIVDGCTVTDISGDRILIDCSDGSAALTLDGTKTITAD